MKAIILGAGMGSRLGQLTLDVPKPLVRVSNFERNDPSDEETTIIDLILTCLNEANVEDITVVGGYQYEKLKEHLRAKKKKWASTIAVVENSQYTRGNILSILAAMKEIQGDLLIMNADHLYPTELLRTFLSEHSDRISIACDFSRKLGDDDMKIALRGAQGTDGSKMNEKGPQKDEKGLQRGIKGSPKGERSTVTRRPVYLERIGKELSTFHGGYIGMTLVPAGLVSVYMDSLIGTIRVHGEDTNVEEVLNSLLSSDIEISITDLSDFYWMEIDTPEDLKRAVAGLNSSDWSTFWERD